MGAARWVVIGTAIVAAAVAFHLLLSPDGSGRSGARPEIARPRETVPESAGSKAVAAPSGPPQEELDAASRDAMRSFLRESAQDDEK